MFVQQNLLFGMRMRRDRRVGGSLTFLLKDVGSNPGCSAMDFSHEVNVALTVSLFTSGRFVKSGRYRQVPHLARISVVHKLVCNKRQ